MFERFVIPDIVECCRQLDFAFYHLDGKGQLPHLDLLLALDDLHGIDRQKAEMVRNTLQFVSGLPANNALLWGARGMGKSSLIKATHGAFPGLKLVEIHREDIAAAINLLAACVCDLDKHDWSF